ncbi:ribosomal protein S18 acetylase RimI-like enzyme [Sphingopyxis sp. OAS728]|uniref:GNAT family N-acetyltransferase n=1 Tax=Sphingopyxis sp. OAS728 TaxID=2663823 RepID=UPI0019F5DCDC|nr:GNAT family N-acetyltransferase [Sphingopyxis sp. OAS728]MBE1529481.1 ribosomal protein S18 acetylase RimI-like enzyme [Sphingopyxis sp. OAS728]
MAEHRGLKLVRSRKRTPGIGDFGKFGLTDAAGKPLLGIGDNGLEASAAEVENFLRGGAVSSWKLSAEASPGPAPSRRNSKNTRTRGDDRDDEHGRAPRKHSAAPPRSKTPARSRPQDPPPPARATPRLRLVEPEPAPALNIRPARAGDAGALRDLLGQLRRPHRDAAIEENLAALMKARGGIMIAELAKPVGCCAWTAVPTLQHGRVGRVTLLLVDGKHRRRGIGTAMLTAAEKALEEAGCRIVEAMSDVMIDNAHGFFRARKFEQASYRFVRTLAPLDG